MRKKKTMNDNKQITVDASSLIKVAALLLGAVLLIGYILSPIDLLPGPIDDIVLTVVALAFGGKALVKKEQ